MTKPNYQLWLWKASQDLRATKRLIEADDELFDIAIFHVHQSAEKALKAFLVFNKISICKTYKTHDLEKLVSICSQFDKRFENILKSAYFLTPYITKFRYPDDYLFPDKKDFEQAIDHAENILKLVKLIIRELSDPNKRIF